MAASGATIIFCCLLITLFSSSYTHARDREFFNKLPSTTNTDVFPNKNQPDFVPDNENSYGLYAGEESAQLSSSATTPQDTESEQPPRKYLPKNYNPVAYVTVPEDINDSVSFKEKTYATNPTNYYNAAENFYNPQQEDESAYRSFPTTTNDDDNNNSNNKNNDFYYNGGSSFNSEPQGLSETKFNNRGNYFDNRGGDNGFQPQGMSDTRYLENGKYFYDLNSEKYSSNHPYESLKAVRPTNRGYFGNYAGDRENNVEFP